MPSREFYRSVIALASDIKQKTSDKLNCIHGSPSCAPEITSIETPLLEISSGSSILQDLLIGGVPPCVAQKLSDRLEKTLSSLRQHLEDEVRRTWLKILDTPRYDSMLPLDRLREQLKATYRTLYDKKAREWADEIHRTAVSRLALSEEQRQPVMGPCSRKPAFNQEFLPLLESFFSEEEFPSRADKLLFAKKSGMTYRQIHVWFQNRRSRTRKLQSTSLHPASDNALSSSDTDIEEGSASEKDYSSRSSSFTLVADSEPFSSYVAAHTFPTKYPPNFIPETDPFPCRFGDFSSFSKANWDRKCSLLPLRQDDAVVDVDALCESFGKLCIRSMPNSERVEVDYPRIWGSYSPRPLSGCDVMAVYTTRPFSAPIPSFIRYPHQEMDLRPCSIFRPQHRDLLQTEPNVSSLHSRDTPSNCKSASKTKRVNKPRLPKRVPTNQPKLSAMSKSMPDPLGLTNTDEADTRTRGRTLTPPLERVALVTRSASSSSDESLPSLTHSVSSSSSSEAQSPSSPAQGLPAESALCFMPELSAISMPDASQGHLVDIPFSLFASPDFNYDLLSSKPFVDNAYDLAFSQSQVDPFLSLQLQPPPAIPQSLPFSFDFTPLTS